MGLFIKVAHFLNTVFNFGINQASSIDGITQERYEHTRQQVVTFADIGIVSEDARGAKLTVIFVIILNGVKDDGHARTLASNGNGGPYTAESFSSSLRIL